LRRFLAFSEARVGNCGITSQQYQALLAIKIVPGDENTIKHLAKQMLLQPHGAVQLVDRLVSAGLVRRTPSSADKRNILLRLTDKGVELLEELAVDHLQELFTHEQLLTESLSRLKQINSLRQG
jgi:DNA-binding MarR family transcriptional regulator